MRKDLDFNSCSIFSGENLLFRDFSWSMADSESWWITGPNGGGKSAFAAALAGKVEIRGSYKKPEPQNVAVVSFEALRELIFQERYFDESDFVEGGVHQGTTTHDFILGKNPSDLSRGSILPPAAYVSMPFRGEFDPDITSPRDLDGAGWDRRKDFDRLTSRMGIAGILSRGLKFLSTGEMRKVLMCRALLSRPALLILDEPFAGLDTATRVFVADLLTELAEDPVSPVTLVLSDRADNMPAHITHVLALCKTNSDEMQAVGLTDRRVSKLRIAFSGPRQDFLEFAKRDAVFSSIAGFHGPVDGGAVAEGDSQRDAALSNRSLSNLQNAVMRNGIHGERESAQALVVLEKLTVSYSDRKVLDGLSWTLMPGRHTLVRGPNGCGKSTLLNIITGDNPQVYANNVTVLGFRRGSGESIWDVKSGIGYVSYQFHIEYIYKCDSNLEEVIISGFYDSIGLYTTPGWSETQTARAWLEIMGMTWRAKEPFQNLSYGEQRAALIARAMVKNPRLLILDECCHGLDPVHRLHILSIADYIGLNTATTIIYVTHAPDEHLDCTREIIDFVPEEADNNVLNSVQAGFERRYRVVFSRV